MAITCKHLREEVIGEQTILVDLTDPKIMDGQMIQELAQELLELAEKFGAKDYVLNFSGVKTLSETAVPVFLEFRDSVTKLRGRIIACNVSPEFQGLRYFLRKKRIVFFVETEEDAFELLGVQLAAAS